jgi:hypothetical protein
VRRTTGGTPRVTGVAGTSGAAALLGAPFAEADAPGSGAVVAGSAADAVGAAPVAELDGLTATSADGAAAVDVGSTRPADTGSTSAGSCAP